MQIVWKAGWNSGIIQRLAGFSLSNAPALRRKTSLSKKEKSFYLSWSHCFLINHQIINIIHNERCFSKVVSLMIFSHFCFFFGLSLILFEVSLIDFRCIYPSSLLLSSRSLWSHFAFVIGMGYPDGLTDNIPNLSEWQNVKRHLVIITFCHKRLIDSSIYCVYFSETDLLNR